MVDIFDEVEEDLRAERASRLLRKYAWLIGVVAVAIIGGVVGWQLWGRWQANQENAAALRYVNAENAAEQATTPQAMTPQATTPQATTPQATTPQATAAGSPARAEAIAAFDQQAATAPQGYRTLSRLRAAGLKADAGDLPGAIALWDQVAADPAADRLLRDLASLMAAQRQLDSGDPNQLEARLKPLAPPDNPWSALAREQLALLDLRQGKVQEAKTALRSLSVDIGAPNGVRQRTAAILTGLGE